MTGTPLIRGTNVSDLIASVRDQIDAGELQAGDVLPSIRSLAGELGVNRNTVAAAYGQLAAAGVVETRRRGGTVVLGVPDLDGEGSTPDGFEANLSGGNPDPAFIPVLHGVMDPDYTPPLYGAAPILDELRCWAEAHMASDVTGDYRLVITHGSVDAVERLLAAHLTRGDSVAVEDPCFLSSIGLLRLGGYHSAAVPVDDQGMTVEGLRTALADGARAVVVTPRAHNPTGASLTSERAAALRAVIAEHPGVLVIEDDHFSAVSSQPYLRVTPDNAPRWALIRSVSKFLGPDLRVALVLADPETANRLESRLSSATTWVSHILQHLTAQLLAAPEVDALLERARSQYARRSASLVRALRTHGIVVNECPDGLNVWIPLPGASSKVVAGLAQRGWAVRPGENFAVAGRPPPAIRVTTSTITKTQAQAFASDLAAILHH